MKLRVFVLTFCLAMSEPCMAGNSDFVQTYCQVTPTGVLELRVNNADGAMRTISFSRPVSDSVIFKGTSLSDMKWIAKYSQFKELVLHKPKADSVVGQLALVDSSSGRRVLGWVSPSCWAQLTEHVSGAVVTRIQNAH
jgi:hypothetical protein